MGRAIMAVAETTLCKGSLLVAHDEIESVQPTDEAVARYWDANADLWTEHVRRGWDAYREHFNNPAFFAFLGEVKGKRVLDAGCGEGYNTRILARRWWESTCQRGSSTRGSSCAG